MKKSKLFIGCILCFKKNNWNIFNNNECYWFLLKKNGEEIEKMNFIGTDLNPLKSLIPHYYIEKDLNNHKFMGYQNL